MGKSDPRKPKYYVDACVFIDLIEHPADQEPAKTIAAILEAAENGECEVVTSTVTIAEVWHAKSEIDHRAPDPEVARKISQLWNPTSSPVQLIDFHELIAREAVAILRSGIDKGWRKTRGVDGIHLGN